MRVLIIICFGSFLFGCNGELDESELKKQVLEADRNFSRMSEEKGMAEAFIYYADENVIRPVPGHQPIYGKYALIESFKKNPPGKVVLTWEPLKAEVSGDLAYTFGGYALQTTSSETKRDTTLFGNYVSIWKRKKDGSWRYVLDTGNPTPGPAVLKR
jgi:ketosteroid isomerase-like protein